MDSSKPEEQKTEGNKIGFKSWLPVILITTVALVFICAYFALKPASVEGEKHITVQIEHLNGDTRTYHYDTTEEYLRPVLCEDHGLISGTEEAYGLWIKTVDGETANESNQEWWGYTVNGTDAMYGVEQQVVTDGDVIVFTLHVGY